MIYSLHPEAESDLREAAEYYRERAGVAIAQAFFGEFEHSECCFLSTRCSGHYGFMASGVWS